MWKRESCETCVICATVTPHTHRRNPFVVLAAFIAFLAALAIWLESLAALTIPLVAMWLVMRPLERHDRIACNRCRDKARARERSNAPNPRSSTIDLL